MKFAVNVAKSQEIILQPIRSSQLDKEGESTIFVKLRIKAVNDDFW